MNVRGIAELLNKKYSEEDLLKKDVNELLEELEDEIQRKDRKSNGQSK